GVFVSSSRRHTRSDRDWSSDVCSSDLLRVDRRDSLGSPGSVEVRGSDLAGSAVLGDLAEVRGVPLDPLFVVAVEEEGLLQLGREIGRASGRERDENYEAYEKQHK